MLARLLDGTTRGARWAAVVAVAMAVGVIVGASALTGHPTRLLTVSDASSSAAVTGSEHAQASKPAKPSKQAKAEKAEAAKRDAAEADGDQGVHGACVSAVARDKDKVGGPHDNHGFVVSRAAHTCPNPRPSSTD